MFLYKYSCGYFNFMDGFMGLNVNLFETLLQYTNRYAKECGKESILLTKTQSFKGINSFKLKLAPQLQNDIVQISNKANIDIIEKMLEQRSKIKYEDIFDNEIFLKSVKDNYCSENRLIRKAVETNCPLSGPDLKQILKLDKVIAQNSIPEDITLYRGLSAHDFGRDTLSAEEFAKKIYKKGKTFKLPLFTSTTLDKNIVHDFMGVKDRSFIFRVNTPKGTNGVYMEKLPNLRYTHNEEEILLARNLKYKFKNCTKENDMYVFDVDIINDDKSLWTRFKKILS